jgi:hypothetical protein
MPWVPTVAPADETTAAAVRGRYELRLGQARALLG